MKGKITETPAVTLIRLQPEKESERKLISEIREALRGTNAIATTPAVDDEKVLSLMFNAHAKKNQKKKA